MKRDGDGELQLIDLEAISESTYSVNLGVVDAAMAASLAADAEEVEVDAQWLERVPIGPRDPNAVPLPGGGIPADPNPGWIFESPTVLTHYQLYRRLVPGVVVFNELGTIKSVDVVNTREWHFLPNGRVLVRFTNHRAGLSFPTTVVDVTDSWGAYAIGPKPNELDVLHRYADHEVLIESDGGEHMEMTIEDGRRHLFWGKDYLILSEWAAERRPIPCQAPAGPDPGLMNNGVSLSTQIEPDQVGDAHGLRLRLAGPEFGSVTLSGTADGAGDLVTERTASLTSPIVWEPVQTNRVTSGPFRFQVPQGANEPGCFRVRVP
ncbi:MAG: hypothetical protein ACYDC1_13450 [Limisphaerales bacterium]